MDKYTQAVLKIVNEQELIIGPLARDLAKRAEGIQIISETEAQVSGDPKLALSNLVRQFNMLFGKTSIEVSKNAIKGTLTQEELPDILR